MVYYSSYRSEDEPPQGHQFFLVECDLFLKSPIKMKGCLIMVYIQEHHLYSEDIIKDSTFQWSLFVIQKYMGMIGLYF